MAGEHLYVRGTTLVLKSSGGDAVWTPTSVADGAGRISARLDLGVFPNPDAVEVVAILKSAAAASAGEVAELWLFQADAAAGSTATSVASTGGFSESDAAITDSDRLRNGDLIGHVVADDEAGFVYVSKRYTIPVTARYIQVAVWNELGVALSATAADCEIRVTPLYLQTQA